MDPTVRIRVALHGGCHAAVTVTRSASQSARTANDGGHKVLYGS
jgi:hypothetical protein